MTAYDRKRRWWLLLVASAGASLLTGCSTVVSLIHGHRGYDFRHFLILFLINIVLVPISILGLRRVYREAPPYWTGRWQLSLADLLFIVFFAGLIMAGFSAMNSYGRNYRAQFLYEGVPLSLGVGLSYATSLLIVSRTGNCPTHWERWLESLVWLVGAGVATICALILQMAILVLVLGL